MVKIFLTTISLLLLMTSCDKKNETVTLLVGTYTDGTSKGVNVYDLDLANDKSTKINELELFNPSFIALSKDKDNLYAITEGDSLTSKVYSYNIDENKNFQLVDSIVVGDGPCFIEVDQYNSIGFTANYGEGSFSYFTIGDQGKLSDSQTIKFEGTGSDSIRQSQPHIHTVRISPENKYIYITDLGTDHIYRYNLIIKDGVTNVDISSLKTFEAPAGSGPRHLAFLPSLSKMYVLTELSGDILIYDIDENGDLKLNSVVKADEFNAAGSADIHISPNGKYLYASHRLENDGISVFSIDNKNGLLSKIGYQKTGVHPRHFLITPDGKKMLTANRDSNNIEVFEVLENGLLEKQSQISDISNPVCVVLWD